MRRILDALGRLFIFPGEWAASRLGVPDTQNRELVRMLINSLFWIAVVVAGLFIWTSTLPIYQ